MEDAENAEKRECGVKLVLSGNLFSNSLHRKDSDDAPEMTRTSDLRFRKPPLYPAELLGPG